MTKNTIENGYFHTTVKGIEQNYAAKNLHKLDFDKDSKKGKRDVQVIPLKNFDTIKFCLNPLEEIPVKLKIISEAEYQKKLELAYDFFLRTEPSLDSMPEEKRFYKMHKYIWLANNEVRQNYICEDDPRLQS